MITYNNNSFILENNYFKYILHVNKDNKLCHIGFWPANSNLDFDMTNYTNRISHPYPFEVIVNINHESLQCSHFNRYYWPLSSYRAVYSDYKKYKKNEIEILEITLIDDLSKLFITLVYEMLDSSPAIRRYTRLKNQNSTDIYINHVSSFVLSNFPYSTRKYNEEEMFLHTYNSQWSWEGGQKRFSFQEAGLMKTWCRNGYVYENLSTMPCQNYFPFYVIEQNPASLFWGIQIEYSGAWRFEAGVNEIGTDNWFYVQGGLLNDKTGHFGKNLLPSEEFITIPCSMVVSDVNISEIYNLMHIHQKEILINKSISDKNLPVIYNDWQCMHGAVTQSKIIKQLDLIQKCGVEVYVIDAGWYTQNNDSIHNNWWDMAGNWEYDKERFPLGLNFIAQEMKKRNIIPGIWCEIEAVGKLSENYNDSDMLMKTGDRFIEDANRRFLNFRSEKAIKFADEVFEKLISYGFEYFKIDYNADPSPGFSIDGSSLDYGLYLHRHAYYSWIERLREKHPSIIIENCASGGMRLEYGMLSRSDLASITDQENNKYMGSILYNVTKLIHPSQCGTWSNVKSEFCVNEYTFTLVNSMMGRMHISGNLMEQLPNQIGLLKESIAFYKKIRKIIDDPYIVYHTDAPDYINQNIIFAFEYKNKLGTEGSLMASRLDSAETSIDILINNINDGEYVLSFFPDIDENKSIMAYNNSFEVNLNLKEKYSSLIMHYIKK